MPISGEPVADTLLSMGFPGVVILVLLGVVAALWKRLAFVQDRELAQSMTTLKETSEVIRETSRAMDALTASVRKSP